MPSSRRASASRSSRWPSSGLPATSRKAFPGRRDEPMRTWTVATIFMRGESAVTGGAQCSCARFHRSLFGVALDEVETLMLDHLPIRAAPTQQVAVGALFDDAAAVE